MNDAAVCQWLERGLRQLAEDLAAGRDVSPARRFRLEGAIECWRLQWSIDEAELQNRLGGSGVAMEVEQGAVRLRMAMRRAPVRPTTSD